MTATTIINFRKLNGERPLRITHHKDTTGISEYMKEMGVEIVFLRGEKKDGQLLYTFYAEQPIRRDKWERLRDLAGVFDVCEM